MGILKASLEGLNKDDGLDFTKVWRNYIQKEAIKTKEFAIDELNTHQYLEPGELNSDDISIKLDFYKHTALDHFQALLSVAQSKKDFTIIIKQMQEVQSYADSKA